MQQTSNYSHDELLRALKNHLVQHFDVGGQVGALGPTAAPGPTSSQTVGNPGAQGWQTAVTPFATVDPTQAFKAVGQIGQGIAQDFTAQNGYNAQLAPTAQTNYQPAIAGGANNALSGYGQFNNNLNNQNELAAALGRQAAGQGPSPADLQLAQSTGNNIASQAALQAGQRGASSNPGLIAREAGQQGAAIQQNAAGQGATLKAQEQLAAESALAGQQQNIAGNITGEQNANTNLFGTAAGAQNSQNTGNIQNYGMVQGINSGVAQANANAVNKTLGGLTNGAGALAALLAKGGEVKENPKLAKVKAKDRMPLPSHIKGMASIFHPKMMASGGSVGNPYMNPFLTDLANVESSGSTGFDPSKAISSIGGSAVKSKSKWAGPSSDSVLNTGTGDNAAQNGGLAALAGLMKSGGDVPGKAEVKGDSYKNDTVPIIASPGEVVLPRSVTMSENPGEAAKAFMENLHSKYKKGDEEDDFKSALSRAVKTRKSK